VWYVIVPHESIFTFSNASSCRTLSSSSCSVIMMSTPLVTLVTVVTISLPPGAIAICLMARVLLPHLQVVTKALAEIAVYCWHLLILPRFGQSGSSWQQFVPRNSKTGKSAKRRQLSTVNCRSPVTLSLSPQVTVCSFSCQFTLVALCQVADVVIGTGGA